MDHVLADAPRSPWNSLEVAKLFASLLTPIVVALVGYIVQQQIAEQGRSWQSQQRIVERRLQVYDTIRNELNRIYCFVEDIGTWKEDNPETVIGFKRHIDQAMHSQRALWARQTFQAYLDYMNTAFATFQGIGTDAKIKTNDYEKKIGISNWKREWSERLTGTRDQKHRENYDRFINLISRDLSLPSQARGGNEP
jgi:hypothetical protein